MKKIAKLTKKTLTISTIYLVSMLMANFLNFVFNAYLGRQLSFESFGLVSLVSTLLYIIGIPLDALSSTVNFRTAFASAKNNNRIMQAFLYHTRKNGIYVGVVITIAWVFASPFLSRFFQVHETLVLLSLAIVISTGIVGAVHRGYLQGRMFFLTLSIIYVTEALSKLIAAVIFVKLGLEHNTYLAIPLSIVLSFIIGLVFVIKHSSRPAPRVSKRVQFPKKYYVYYLISSVSTFAFLTFDVLIVKHVMTPTVAGQYAFLALVGKIIFFLGYLVNSFITTFVSRKLGFNQNTTKTFYTLLGITGVLTLGAYIVVGPLGFIVLPILFGAKAYAILPYIMYYGIAIVAITLANAFVTYHIAKQQFVFPVLMITAAISMVVGISFVHETIFAITVVMVFISITNLLVVVACHLFESNRKYILENVKNFSDIFTKFPDKKIYKNKQIKILIYNWRDIRHTWAGGAETYIHELSKYWVANGYYVTIFCGNDGTSPRNEKIDDIQIIRRGGFSTVYIWAALYYITKFRGLFDVIIDSENGIPFFTPLYSRKPKFLLIHHIHQEVFRASLIWPKALLAQFLETKCMPFVYRNAHVVTVSESSKKEIEKVNHKRFDSIDIIHPGIHPKEYKPRTKTKYPSFLYVGRLKPYKRVDIIIKAFKEISDLYPNAKLRIAGDGETRMILEALVKHLGLEKKITILGKVSEEEKRQLYAKSWVVLQPSMMEGWGITVIEANACKTPVVASDVNGLKDSIVHGQTGLLVKAGSVTQFSVAMVTLIAEKELRTKLSEQAYAWSRKFTWDDSAKKFTRILDAHLTEDHKTFAGKLVLGKADL